jgi:hypothetical protein
MSMGSHINEIEREKQVRLMCRSTIKPSSHRSALNLMKHEAASAPNVHGALLQLSTHQMTSKTAHIRDIQEQNATITFMKAVILHQSFYTSHFKLVDQRRHRGMCCMDNS